jgi:branched-subunit amino acid aminotransferase/4-amino-4-deoxychorismate lyase
MDSVAMVNGQRQPLAAASLAITDDGAVRGDGAFETVGVWDGRAFRLRDHLRRLAGSLSAVALPPVDLDLIAREAAQLLHGVTEDGALRVYITASGTRVLTLSPPPQRPDTRSLEPQPAPWIRPVGTFAPAGAKTMSYVANMAATRMAQRQGADDALLVSLEGWVLEGPTFAVLFAVEGVVHAAPVSLGIVDSISRRTVLELAAEEGIDVVAEPTPLAVLLDADEVMISSAVRDLLPIRRVGTTVFEGPTPLRDRLARRLDQSRRSAHG